MMMMKKRKDTQLMDSLWLKNRKKIGCVLCVCVYLKEIGISERCTKTKDEVTLWMFGYRLHDGTVYDDEMFGCGFDVATLAGIARIEE
jgi:hypothetical protein